ncbi:MAG TPA: pyridoxal-phosphate dependent enzyme [Alloacidobacterium sp.]|nr:pyridoxal-phosphate dependent enzyme [Alloacidobacterium sp.]
MQDPSLNPKNVFAGPDSLKSFLDPDRNPPLPLVELPESLNPFAAQKVRIFAKLLYLLPLLNLKSLPVLSMLQNAGKELDGIHTLVENSSGNTAFSLAIVARLFGIRSVRAIVPIDIAPGKLELLRLAGAEVRFAPPEGGGVALARRMGQRSGFRNLGQYENPANIEAHARWTAKQVWEQTDGKLTIYATGLGTTGTALGAVRFFRENGSKVPVLGVYCLPGSAVPGVRSLQTLKEISFDWQSEVPLRVGVTTSESYKKSLDLCRAGLLAGPSSGFALAGLLHYLEDEKHLDDLRNSEGEIVAAFICCDTPFPYLDKYSTILDPTDFIVPGAHEEDD